MIQKSYSRIASIINRSAPAGTVLGIVSIACMFINQLCATLCETSPFLGNLLSFVVWLAKFIGCIWLMKFFMKRFAAREEEVNNKDTFLFGLFAALLSSLLFAALTMLNMAVISPELYQAQYDMALQAVAPMLDSNTMAKMSSIMENIHEIAFFQTFIYCFLYGIILSAILSRNIPARDPFAQFKNNEENAE